MRLRNSVSSDSGTFTWNGWTDALSESASSAKALTAELLFAGIFCVTTCSGFAGQQHYGTFKLKK
jgi:hypothetical protein